MKGTHSEDLEFLRKIRGRFQESASHRRGEWGLILIFAIIFPVIFIALFFVAGPPALDGDHLLCAALLLGSLYMDVQIWRGRGVEYEFTGEEVIERRRGQVHGRVPIVEILETRVLINPHRMILRTTCAKMEVRIYPALNEVIQQEVARAATDEARQRMENVKQEMAAGKRRALWIGGIGLIILIVGILLFVGNSGGGIKK